MTTSSLLWNIFLSAAGLAYITYGKTQRKVIPLLGGIVLMLAPYFVDKGYFLFGILFFVITSSYVINV